MNAPELFAAFRAHKRELTGNALDTLTQAEVDAINAVIRQWKPEPHLAPKRLTDPQAFFKLVRAAFGGLEQKQVDGFSALLAAMGKAGWPLSWTAYGLATAYHETAHTMQPVKEYGGAAYLKKMYDIEGARPAKARELGNLSPGDGEKFGGRGYPQLTGRANYEKAGRACGLPLVNDPDLMLRPDVASSVMIWGMEQGAFTGKKLADYLPQHGEANHRQFELARYIINGTDKAAAIAKIAIAFQSALAEGGWE